MGIITAINTYAAYPVKASAAKVSAVYEPGSSGVKLGEKSIDVASEQRLKGTCSHWKIGGGSSASHVYCTGAVYHDCISLFWRSPPSATTTHIGAVSELIAYRGDLGHKRI